MSWRGRHLWVRPYAHSWTDGRTHNKFGCGAPRGATSVELHRFPAPRRDYHGATASQSNPNHEPWRARFWFQGWDQKLTPIRSREKLVSRVAWSTPGLTSIMPAARLASFPSSAQDYHGKKPPRAGTHLPLSSKKHWIAPRHQIQHNALERRFFFLRVSSSLLCFVRTLPKSS